MVSRARIRLRYLRLPDDLTDVDNELVYRDERVIVARYVTPIPKSVVFDNEVVLAAGYQVTYSELLDQWFTVCKIRIRKESIQDTTATSPLRPNSLKTGLNKQTCS